MTPALRKFALTAHITTSVGWLGAVISFLALALVGVMSKEAQMVRTAYLAMEMTVWYVIVPLAIASLITGLVQSLGTTWGLFRHYWIVAKFLITIVATILLLVHTKPVAVLADAAREATFSISNYRGLQIQLIGDAVAAIVLLVVATVLSVYKPGSMTAYGRRKQLEASKYQANVPALDDVPAVGLDRVDLNRTPRWVYVVGIHALGLTILFLVFHLLGGGLPIH
jgi:hypothetical protein